MSLYRDEIQPGRPQTFDAIGSGLLGSLVGHEYDFYGIDGSCFAIGLEGNVIVLEAVDDPNDGYRSYLDTIIVNMEGKIFFKTPIARVRLEELVHITNDDFVDFKGYRLTDVDGDHAWLLVGTDYADDYYPMFVFRYEPKPPEEGIEDAGT